MLTIDDLLDNLDFEIPNGDASASPTDNTEPPAPGWDHLGPDYWAAWAAHMAGDRLVVAIDTQTPADHGYISFRMFVVDDNGLLNAREELTALLGDASRAYLTSCSGMDNPKEFGAACKHANALRLAGNADIIRANIGTSMDHYSDCWRDAVVVDVDELDSDLTVIGLPNGVWSIPDHRILTPAEARERLVTVTIRWPYDKNADHPVANRLFAYLYGNLTDTTTTEFKRWRLAATALSRRPMEEIIVKISDTRSAKTTEGNVQRFVFAPLVADGKRAAIEDVAARYSAGGQSHNSYLTDFVAPVRRVNVPEISSGGDDADKTRRLDTQLLRDLSEANSVTYRIPGPYPATTKPFYAHIFLDGNMPPKGQDLLRIAGADGGDDNAQAVLRRLRGSPYAQIPEADVDPSLAAYGNYRRAHCADDIADIAAFNRTILRLMLDGMTQHWGLLMEQLPAADGADLIYQVKNIGKAPWITDWLPYALEPDAVGSVDAAAVYADYRAWHQATQDGDPVHKRIVIRMAKQHYGVTADRFRKTVNGKVIWRQPFPGWRIRRES